MQTDKVASESTAPVETVDTECGPVPVEFCLDDVRPDTPLGWWIADTCRACRNEWTDAALLKLITSSDATPCDGDPTTWRMSYSEFGPIRLDGRPSTDDGNGGLRKMTDAELAELQEALRSETEEDARMRATREAGWGGVLDQAWADKRRRLRDIKRAKLLLRYRKQQAYMRTGPCTYLKWEAKVTQTLSPATAPRF